MRNHFFYRDLKLRGIPYQYMPARRFSFGYERCGYERCISWDPACDASYRYWKRVERILRRGECSKYPLFICRFVFRSWFNLMTRSVKWKRYLPKYKIAILNRMMYLTRKYLASGRIPTATMHCDPDDYLRWLLTKSVAYVNNHFKRED